jgi:hypothetical protein
MKSIIALLVLAATITSANAARTICERNVYGQHECRTTYGNEWVPGGSTTRTTICERNVYGQTECNTR